MTFRFGAASRVRYESSEATAQRLLAYIVGYQRERGGVSPSFPDMQGGIGLRSKSSVHRLLQILIAQRKIRMLPHRARAIEVVGDTVPDARRKLPTGFLDTRGWQAFMMARDTNGDAVLVPMDKP